MCHSFEAKPNTVKFINENHPDDEKLNIEINLLPDDQEKPQ